MTTNESYPFDEAAADQYAADLIQQAAQEGGDFNPTVTQWMTRVLRGKNYNPHEGVGAEMIKEYGKEHIPQLMDVIAALDTCARVPAARMDLQARFQIGLYLSGMRAYEIYDIYPPQTYGQVNDIRSKFIKAIDSDRLSEPTRQTIATLRSQALEAISNNRTQTTPEQRVEAAANAAELLFANELYVYSARDILEDIETQYILKEKLRAEDRGVLARHFLDATYQETNEDRYRMGQALHDLRGIFAYQRALKPIHPGQKTLHESVQFLEVMMGSGSGVEKKLPRSRADAMRKLAAQNPHAIGEDEAAIIERDDHRLDIAFTWMFANKDNQKKRS
jgi:hypothetical protein